MRLEDYWGVGPKTAALLREELGEEAAIEAIEAADGRTLVAAGLPSGRATRILRRVQGGDGMDLLATRDARSVYRNLVSQAESFAVTGYAADRVRVLTPLRDREAIEERLADVTAAVDSWRALDDDTREAVVAAFEAHDDRAGTAAAVETALALRDTGVSEGVFAPLADLDAETLRESAVALRALEAEGVGEGADEELDRLRAALGEVEDMTADAGSVAESVQSAARDASDFRDAMLREITSESRVERETVRDAMPDDAIDTTAFATETLRTLSTDLRERVHDREQAVRESLEGDVEAGRDAVDAAVETVDDVALQVSLARFAVAFDLRAPTLVEGDALAMRGARNLDLLAADVSVQSVDYAVGDHSLGGEAPSGDRVAVLTGANSGGKTTLLETLCQVALLAHMGLPVPAEECEVGLVDSLVFHRRHASFNAGVLESTLRSVVPPLTTEGRTLMLVDEFEAITEPGSAADLLHGLVTLTVERDALGAYVTHLAEDLEPLPEVARVDGIFAEGLTPDLELEVDYQPRFGTVGRSTPEFIVSRLVAEASDTNERMGFETLAASVGQEVVQRTLADVRWSAEEGD
ncbi:MutS-related protein [Halomarina rubra]|uniref:DNA mismatch repair protein n=1 Tax=Halomarina rubra TaxID=2071873 RepID=A0ABD6AT45_9EURY|nr:DNA mismatch repair protein [Halomarina rubra]